jgi:hypothetical protein
MAAILIETSVIEPPTEMGAGGLAKMSTERPGADPARLAGTTTSLGSYCLRWQLVLSGQSQTVAFNRRQLPGR